MKRKRTHITFKKKKKRRKKVSNTDLDQQGNEISDDFRTDEVFVASIENQLEKMVDSQPKKEDTHAEEKILTKKVERPRINFFETKLRNIRQRKNTQKRERKKQQKKEKQVKKVQQDFRVQTMKTPKEKSNVEIFGFFVDYVILENGHKSPAKLALVDSDKRVVMNTTILPNHPDIGIQKYRTAETFLTSTDFLPRNNPKSKAEVRSELLYYLQSRNAKCVLVGCDVAVHLKMIKLRKIKENNIAVRDISFHQFINRKRKKPTVQDLATVYTHVFKGSRKKNEKAVEKAVSCLQVYMKLKRPFDKMHSRMNVLKRTAKKK